MSIRRAASWGQPLAVRRVPLGARMFKMGSDAVFATISLLETDLLKNIP
jgi:hypothetical protein